MSPVQDIERLLRDTMGLDAETLGLNAIERAVRARLAALASEHANAHSSEPATDRLDISTYAQYLQRLQQSPQELQALIETVVVPETWFFRHREAFTALAQMALDERAARRGTLREGHALRLLSLPCSTGEEPYSMAMTLFDAGFAAGHFTIDALDISERALAVAREGVYGRNSFRGPPATMLFRDRYFTPEGENHKIIGALRTQVRWHAGNLFDASLVDRLGTFDFVFFRNVLIYFDRDGQRRAIAALEQLMRMGATLFAGPAEGGTLTTNGLTSTGHVQAFSFRVAGPTRDLTAVPSSTANAQFTGSLDTFRTTPPVSAVDALAQWRAQTDATRTTLTTRTLASSVHPTPMVTTSPTQSSVPSVTPSTEVAATADIDALLTQARAAADAGDFEHAVALCRNVLAIDRANAHAEYLLGLVEDARGDAQGALIHYRRALYLDPSHYEALVHCAAQLDARGDADGARRLLERAGRAERAAQTTTERHDQTPRHGTRHR